MADRSLRDLNYGYPGSASYDLESSEWAFARQYATRSFKQIRTLSGIHLADTLATTPIQLPHPQTHANTTRIQKEVRNRVRDNPQLASAAVLLPELSLLSATISATASTYDPLIGNLLSLGSITLGDRHEDARQVAALPTGEAGNVLRLAILNKERHGWGMARKTWVDGPTLREAESGYWNEEAAPIQQICFAQTEDRSSLLAVRLPTRTVFFHPICFRQARAAGSSPFHRLPPSTVDAHPVFSIDKDRTGGFPHSHVVFNPDFQLQFALVDQSQTWSVWDIEHPRKGDVYSPSCLVRGPISDSETEDTGEDGWARILWVADVTTLLVCNRRHLSIVSIRGGKPKYLPCPTIFSERSAEWFLDVKQHPKNRDRVFVLTSSRLILMAITASVVDDASTDDAGVMILASWRHYRSAEDFTLRMGVQTLSKDESCLTLYSRLNGLIQLYSFREHPTTSSIVVCSDPGILDLAIDGQSRITNLHLEPMQQGGIRTDIDFFRLFVTMSDHGVHELVVYTGKSSMHETPNAYQGVEDFTRSIIRRPRIGTSKMDVVSKEDEFVVPDGLTAVETPSSKNPVQVWKQGEISENPSEQATRDNELLSGALRRLEHTGEGLYDSINVAAVTNEVKQMLAEDPDTVPLPNGTLMEYAIVKLDVPDVDDASSSLQRLLVGNEESILCLRRIASAQTLSLTEDGEPTISDLYDTLLQTWVAPLPSQVPVRVRQHKERLARRIAAEVMFSSVCIREHETDEQIAGSQLGPSQHSGIALPILPSRPRDGDPHFESHYPSSQPLPTHPPSSMPPSSLPPSSLPASSPPVSPAMQPAPSDPLVRLGKHLRNKQSFPTPVKVGANASQVLGHWQINGDPSRYDWLATERALRPEEMDEESQQQREKERKRKERRQKRQQREDELSRAKAASQSVMFPRSSPGPMLGGIGSSSQIPIQSQSQSQSQVPISSGGFVIPQSQVQPGKFGGRLDKKKKKKGRVSGF